MLSALMTIDGTIPTEIGLLTELSYLVLGEQYCFVVAVYLRSRSSIPSKIGLFAFIPLVVTNLWALHYWSLSDFYFTEYTLSAFNDIGGTIPTEIGLLTALEVLYLSEQARVCWFYFSSFVTLSHFSNLNLYYFLLCLFK